MKKLFLFLTMLVLLSLSACKVAPVEESSIKAVETPAQQWEYSVVSARCAYDSGTGEIVCVDTKTADGTYLGNLLQSMAGQGYELDEVVQTNNSGGMVQSFIFRREFQSMTAGE